tara:strand:+ start:87 stop:821 length:735 start_codon:yes stop_codon:yes gene_type:complete
MGGNDFVFPMVQFKIRDNGWDNIIKVYSQFKNLYNDTFIIKLNGDINYQNFHNFLYLAYNQEDDMVRIVKNKKRFFKPLPNNLEERISHYHHAYINDAEKVNYNSNNWREQYQKRYLLPNAGLEYLKSLVWCWEYYNNLNVVSWDFAYPYLHAPTLIDVLNTFTEKFTFVKGQCCTPLEQLSIILPQSSKHLLPEKLQILHKRSDTMYLYPNTFDMCFDSKMIYSVPILPRIQLDYFKTVVNAL